MHVLLTILLLTQTVAHWQPPMQPQRGRLTLVVRDGNGKPLPAVRVALYHDADDGRVELGERTTDQAGRIVYPDLQWGLYIVQFRGTLPSGQAILPADRQNLGLLDDGSGAGNGFGVRFARTERTELFVLKTIAGEPNAVPMFDLASGPDLPPQPVDPLLAAATPEPGHSDRRARSQASPTADGPTVATAAGVTRGLSPAVVVIGIALSGLLLLFAGLLLLGWWRARTAARERRP
jgi:hypothetical protein